MAAFESWAPFRDIVVLQNRLNSRLAEKASGSAGESARAAAAFTPAVDIYEDAGTVVLHLEAPGMKAGDFQIQVENRTLSVSGERKFAVEAKSENFHRVEQRYGSFFRAFTLPQTVDTEHVEAIYEAGVLRVELKKRAEAKPRLIKVTAASPVGASVETAVQAEAVAGQATA